MDTIKNFMQADPSFAGVGAYYSNVPMKVFMGNEPALPVAVAAEALDKLQAGAAGPQHKAAMQQRAQSNSCMSSCLDNASKQCQQVLKSTAGGAADSMAKQCMQASKSFCSTSCQGV
jgi:hypothetical protein